MQIIEECEMKGCSAVGRKQTPFHPSQLPVCSEEVIELAYLVLEAKIKKSYRSVVTTIDRLVGLPYSVSTNYERNDLAERMNA